MNCENIVKYCENIVKYCENIVKYCKYVRILQILIKFSLIARKIKVYVYIYIYIYIYIYTFEIYIYTYVHFRLTLIEISKEDRSPFPSLRFHSLLFFSFLFLCIVFSTYFRVSILRHRPGEVNGLSGSSMY